MQAREVMTPGVISVSVSTPIDVVARLLKMYRITGVPVVDADAQVVGIVRTDDLFVRERGLPFSRFKVTTLFDEWVDLNRLVHRYGTLCRRIAADVMAPPPPRVDGDTDVADVVRLMLRRNTRHVLVLDGGELAGIITRTDVVGLLARAEEQA
jgi:CBS domain-containing protein